MGWSKTMLEHTHTYIYIHMFIYIYTPFNVHLHTYFRLTRYMIHMYTVISKYTELFNVVGNRCDVDWHNYSMRKIVISCDTISGWWFGTFLFSHILGIIIPTDWYFAEGLKPPTRYVSIVWRLSYSCGSVKPIDKDNPMMNHPNLTRHEWVFTWN